MSEKNVSTVLLETFLVVFIMLIIAAGGGFYFVKFTEQGRELLNEFLYPKPIETVKAITLPRSLHNQIILQTSEEEIVTIPIDARGVLYEFNKGLKVGTEWPLNSGFLVLCKGDDVSLLGYNYVKFDGKIAKNGLDALSSLDTNTDNKIDSKDVDFESLFVWIDENLNGVVDEDELHSLSKLNIVSINLDSAVNINKKINQSIFTQKGSFTKADGSEGVFFDASLFQDPFYRTFTDDLPVSDTIQKLPDIEGAGVARDFREASSLNGELYTVATEVLEAQHVERKKALMDKLLFEWALTANYPTLAERIQSNSTPNFSVKLDDGFLVNKYSMEDGLYNELLRKIRILEIFNAKNIVYFFSEEKFDPSTKIWEYTLTISFYEQHIATYTFTNNEGAPRKKILLAPEMVTFTSAQRVNINTQYNELKESIFEALNKKDEIKKAFKTDNWVSIFFKERIESREKYRYLQKKPLDIRQRHLSDCIKPNNVIDKRVVECMTGKGPKTW